MKMKMFALTMLSLAGLAMSATPASAWWWHRNHGINRYSTVIVCRPYNAFTPVCSGSMVCDGCCPFACPNLPTGACCSPSLCNPLLGMCHDPAGINYASAPYGGMHGPAYGPAHFGAPMPQGGAPQQFQQQFQPPAPMPVPMQAQVPMNYPLQAAGYHQGAYPVYYPIMPAPIQMNPYQYQQAPAYWYGN